MSQGALTKAFLALWPALRRFAIKIGRWLIETLAEEGRKGLMVYLRQRVRVMKRRLARIIARRRRMKSKRGKRYEIENWRVRWLRGRISRWWKAHEWLDSKQAQRLKGRVIDLAVERAKREIPEDAPEEDFTRYMRKVRAR